MKILFRVILLILFVNYQNNQLTKNVSEKKITTYQKDFAKVDTIKTNSFLHLIARMEITEKYHLSRVGRYAYRKSKKGNALFEVRSRCSFANYIVSLRQNILSYGR